MWNTWENWAPLSIGSQGPLLMEILEWVSMGESPGMFWPRISSVKQGPVQAQATWNSPGLTPACLGPMLHVEEQGSETPSMESWDSVDSLGPPPLATLSWELCLTMRLCRWENQNGSQQRQQGMWEISGPGDHITCCPASGSVSPSKADGLQWDTCQCLCFVFVVSLTLSFVLESCQVMLTLNS